MRFLSSRYRYIIDQGITRFLPRARTDQPDKISSCNIARGNAAASTNCARPGSWRTRASAARNVRPRHVSVLTWATSFGSNTRSRFMTPVCWRCFSRPIALFSPATPARPTCVLYVDTATRNVQYVRQVETLPLLSTRRDRREKYWNVRTVPFPSSIESRDNGGFLCVTCNIGGKVFVVYMCTCVYVYGTFW